ncbi:hypothetical protein QTH91_20995 [Variovorax dokdonensis]|uniref:DUF2946 domain-containing protein n=1 Tax=Variovorax dokdonensis TaxID=344883 RepID=A0ABT7NG97_9BURK|nr:DUF2946 family protein [Variovorax dokdonensis]MDM0046982.1 hypothetical protein [Variovorax dokdonensis]
MNALRRLPQLGRLMLLWFALSLGVAVASPLVHPQALELVCSSAGAIKVMVKTDDGARQLGASHIDCPLCALTGAPPPPAPVVHVEHAQPLGHVLQSIPAAHHPAATAAPLPPRGPPAFA